VETKKIAVLIGSLRKESYTRKVAKAMMSLAPEAFQMEEVKLADLAIYNQDLDDQVPPPAAWTEFRERMAGFDAFLFVTPEYNRSVPAVMKNALDVGSRPFGKSIWNGKPGAVVSVSPGLIGGFGANHHLRQSLVFLNVPTLQQPEAYIGNAATLFDEEGALINEKTKGYLIKILEAFSAFVALNAPKKSS
jgi:chromate reductase, NAD(P)H dehydrogenase (quinone)